MLLILDQNLAVSILPDSDSTDERTRLIDAVNQHRTEVHFLYTYQNRTQCSKEVFPRGPSSYLA